MSNWDRTFSNGSYYTHWYGRLVYNVTSQEAGNNRSYIEFYLQAFSDNGAYTQNGGWDARIYVNGNQYARSTPTASISSSPTTLTSWGGWIAHDVNGNLYIEPGDYINAPYNEMTQSQFGWNLPRIALAPTISSYTAINIKPTVVTFSGAVSSNGHGTSNAMQFQYRLQGDSTWIPVATGYTQTITGLKPGKTYEYQAIAWNNNNDYTPWQGTKTFKTKAVAGMVPLLMGLL